MASIAGMKGIIIGGGIAGLTTAIALRQAGVEVEVHEAAPELKPVGAGISLSINAMRVYRRLGLHEAIAAMGAPAHHLRACDHKQRVINETDGRKYAEQYGVGFVLIHRARLQDTLMAALPEGIVHTGRRLAHFEDNGTSVEAHFEDGHVATGDFLIGADGIHSATRRQLFPGAKLRYSGQTCWRGITQFSLTSDASNIQFEAWGGEYRFGCTPIGFGEVYWFAVQAAPAGGKDGSKQLNEELAGKFAHFASPVPELLHATDPSHIIRNDLYDLEPMPRWHHGRALLIGDAAHATTPNMGQGGCQAAEDAHYLRKLFVKGLPLPELFMEFERIRRPKVDWVVNNSWRFGKMAHWRYGKGLRNALLRMMPKSVTDKQLSRVFDIDE